MPRGDEQVALNLPWHWSWGLRELPTPVDCKCLQGGLHWEVHFLDHSWSLPAFVGQNPTETCNHA